MWELTKAHFHKKAHLECLIGYFSTSCTGETHCCQHSEWSLQKYLNEISSAPIYACVFGLVVFKITHTHTTLHTHTHTLHIPKLEKTTCWHTYTEKVNTMHSHKLERVHVGLLHKNLCSRQCPSPFSKRAGSGGPEA